MDLGRCLSRPGQFFAGAEYIYARSCFSEAFAYLINDASTPPPGGQQYVEYDFDYRSSYRFYGGYRFCDCCAEIVFDFARYRSEADFNVSDDIFGGTVSQEVILGPYEINAPDGGFLQGDLDVDIQSYGLGIARSIPLGSPLCASSCGCGDTCCDTCCDDCCDDCCCWCPAWDITWYAGVRYADVGWSRGQTGFFGNGNVDATSATQLDFDGVGARIGLLGRRYIGRRGFASIYAKGDISLLVGDVDISTFRQEVDNGDPLVRVHENSACRMIPVTEIEAGLSGHIGCHVTVSSGYFLSAWHDLGIRDTYDFGGNFQLNHYDDANILGFHGLFARAEVAY
ncbi:MAG: Lpg1974 family pore-forming outer membrane protein [Pseudomonadales bacterium]